MPVTPKWRNGAGMAMILALIAVWSVAAVTIGERLHGLPTLLLILYYAVAGLAWAARGPVSGQSTASWDGVPA